MKTLLKNTTTGKYLAERGKWTENPAAAKAFSDETKAMDYFTFRKMPNVAVAKLPEPGDAVVQVSTPAPADKRKPEQKPAIAAQNVKPAETTAASIESKTSTPIEPPAKPAEEKVKTKATRSDKQSETAPAEKVTVIDAKMDVGFGNSLFIRGQGAGLSWDQGQPLKCINGTTWVWSTAHAEDKVVFKLLLNDAVWAQGGDQVVQAGKLVEIAPVF
jgi:hypothetical protein